MIQMIKWLLIGAALITALYYIAIGVIYLIIMNGGHLTI